MEFGYPDFYSAFHWLLYGFIPGQKTQFQGSVKESDGMGTLGPLIFKFFKNKMYSVTPSFVKIQTLV